ncbi:MAG: flagellar export protein FliJ [Methylococcales bacterium]|jgi:flagellar protein FliJ|nr:flagellar export protein FliJ [Methylococcales bacterium]
MLASKRLQPIVKMAEQKETAAAQKMGQSQMSLRDLEAQLQSLVTMRADYMRRFQSSGSQLSAIRLQEFRRFLDKLDKGITQQHMAIQQAKHDVSMKKSSWLKEHARHSSLQKITDKRQQQEQKQADKREQQVMDEHSQQIFARRLAV